MNDRRIRRLIALFVVAGAPALLMIWYRMHQSTGFASIELIVYPLVFGSLGIAVIWLLKHFYLGESLSSLSSGEGGLVADVLWGIALTMVYFVLFFAARYILSDLLAFTPNRELLGLMLDMRENPWMVILWFGPVLWIGIALYEELVRMDWHRLIRRISTNVLAFRIVVFLEESVLDRIGRSFCCIGGWPNALEPRAIRYGDNSHQEYRDRYILLPPSPTIAPRGRACSLRWFAGWNTIANLPTLVDQCIHGPEITNDRFGSLAVLFSHFSPMSGSERKADVGSGENQ
jgi:hypothetical protein